MTITTPICARIGCDTSVLKDGQLCKDCEFWMDMRPMPPVKPPRPPEPQFSMSNAELADAIEWARASLGKIPGNETTVAARVKKHLFDLLDVQAMRAKALHLPNQ
jgi:hypothetical protein